MIDLPNLFVFTATLAAVYFLPGPDMALVISTSAQRGPKSGLMAALGLAISRTLHVTLSALGLAALFHTHPILFDCVRWAGAAYLMWLAWKMIRSCESDASEMVSGADTGLAAIQRGLMTNLLNPKALVFCSLLLPQFISVRQDFTVQYVLLGSILVGLGLLFDMAYALAASSLATRLSGSRTFQKFSKLAFSSVFGFAAIRLAISGS